MLCLSRCSTAAHRQGDSRSPENNPLEVVDAFLSTRLPIRKVRSRSRQSKRSMKVHCIIFGVGSSLAISLVEAGPPLFVTEICFSRVDAILSEILTQWDMSDCSF